MTSEKHDTTARLASFALMTKRDELPLPARQVMALSILDWFAVALAAKEEAVSRILLNFVKTEASQGRATLLSDGSKCAPRQAALANATLAHALDYDDTHFHHIGHPGAVVVSATLAVAETLDKSIGDWLDAALIGAEASIHIGGFLGRRHYQTGYHQTATAGAFGACLGLARLYDLNEAQTINALGIISTRASGLKSQFGTMGKPFNAGLAASNAVEAVLLAREGLVSCENGLEGPQGFSRTHHGEGNIDEILSLGKTFHFEKVSHKYYACCHGLHATIEALRQTRSQASFSAEDVEAINITVHPRWLTTCDIKKPATGLEAKFSYTMTTALVLHGYNISNPETYQDEICSSETLVPICNRVGVKDDDKLSEMQAKTEIILKSGQKISAFYDLDDLPSIMERQKRLADKASSLIGKQKTQAIFQPLQGALSGEETSVINWMRTII